MPTKPRDLCVGRASCVRVAWISLVLCGFVPVGSWADAQTSPPVRVAGSSLMAPATDDLAKEFMKDHPDVNIAVRGGGTARAVRYFLDKDVDIVLATRDLTAGEREQASTKGVKPVERIVGWGCVMIVTNPRNPVNELTLEQVKGIFSGAITSWSGVGGPDQPIEVFITDERNHGTPVFFRETVLGGQTYTPQAKVEEDYQPIIRKVSRNDWAVGFCLMNKALDAMDKVRSLPIKKDAASPAVTPSRATAKDKTYPIHRPVRLFWDAGAPNAGRDELIAFVEKRGLELK